MGSKAGAENSSGIHGMAASMSRTPRFGARFLDAGSAPWDRRLAQQREHALVRNRVEHVPARGCIISAAHSASSSGSPGSSAVLLRDEPSSARRSGHSAAHYRLGRGRAVRSRARALSQCATSVARRGHIRTIIASRGTIGSRRDVDGVDDLGEVDGLRVDGGDPEARVPELALDDDQRDAFPSHPDGVGVAKPVRARTIAARPPGRRRGASSA
jgi:hypothetical protein